MSDKEKQRIINTPHRVIQYLIRCNSLAFNSAVKDGYDLADFATKFMSSEVAGILDKNPDYYLEKAPSQLYQDFLCECVQKGILLKKEQKGEMDPFKLTEIAQWMGLIYRLAHFKTGDSSKYLVGFIPPERLMQANWFDLDNNPDQWIEDYYWDNDLDKYLEIFGLNYDGQHTLY